MIISPLNKADTIVCKYFLPSNRSLFKLPLRFMKKFLRVILAFSLCGQTTLAQDKKNTEIDAFAAKTGAVITVDKATNSINFLRFPATKTFNQTGGSTDQKVLSFLAENKGLFTTQSDESSFITKGKKKDSHGFEHVLMQQYFKGVPVFDGLMKFHFNENVELASINGNFIPIDKLNHVPAITKEDAAKEAIRLVTAQKAGSYKASLKVNKNTLFVFQKGLAQGYQGEKFLVYEVEVRNDADVREFLYIDAHTKALVEQFTAMHHIDRKLYESSTANLKWQESNGTNGAEFAALNTWQQSEVVASEHIYNLMKNAFNYLSYDNNNAAMITINNNPSIDCPNANWNGVTANYCDGTASDDVVAHEWGHAYTEHTSDLLYLWQAGALNEAYSDIWGETVDQLNNYMDNGESNAIRNACGSSARWQIGEKATSFGGTLRDMWTPNCFGDPGKVSDTQYWCGGTDYGGVHINSGVINHAYALLVDGGMYNGQVITGLGLTKAAHIFWRAQSEYVTKTTDFASFADILQASLLDLIGKNLPALSTSAAAPMASGQIISAADAAELAKVIAAVELRLERDCGYQPLLKPVSILCGGGLPEHAIFFENFESGTGSWTLSNSEVSNTWSLRNWLLKTNAPEGRAGTVAYGVDFAGQNCTTDAQNGIISLISPVITIPAGSSGAYTMAFDHYISLEAGYDGGNIRYRINNGAWDVIPAAAFMANGYNSVLKTSAQGSANPLQGQPGFSGADGGKVTGTWGQSRINLSSLNLQAGQTIQFSWNLGTDKCGGWDGWYIDDVRVYTCASQSVQFADAGTTLNESEAVTAGASPRQCLKYVDKIVAVKINAAPAQPVTVTFKTPLGTATQGATADYEIIPASFTLSAGNLSKNVVIRIYNDAYVEGNETIKLAYNLTNPVGGNAYPETYNQEYSITIVDDDFVPGTVSTTLVSEDFNLGLLSGWNVVGGGDYPDTWSVLQNNSDVLDLNGRPFLFINSDKAGSVNMDKVVESAPFNSVGMTGIHLSFIEYFRVYSAGVAEQALVDVWTGSTWQNVSTQTETTGSSGSWAAPFLRNISIPASYANPNMKIRFRYIARYDWWWAIDNVKIIGISPKPIQSAVTVNADKQYLGPNATVYFYDPANGNLMAKIKNLSAHDYGCTSVEIDRAGVDETIWYGDKHITSKTFKVTPTVNNSVGNHEITLYYKASELANFNGSDIRSMGKSAGTIAAGTSATSSLEPVQMRAFNNDYAYTATFRTGFSGFGLSDAFPSGPLPVTLAAFEGQNRAEGNLLNWITTSEVNNEYFAVEKTLNGLDYKEIGRTAGMGNSSAVNHYKYLDTAPVQGINYYRLKQVDKNGRYDYSRIIAVNTGKFRELKFYPNPAQSVLTVELPDAGMQSVGVKIINMLGQAVLVRNNGTITNGNLNLELGTLPSGIYQIVLSGEKTSYRLSFFKL